MLLGFVSFSHRLNASLPSLASVCATSEKWTDLKLKRFSLSRRVFLTKEGSVFRLRSTREDVFNKSS